MPLPRRSLTSVLLRREGELFLFDCGEGTQVALRRLNLRWKRISVIFITHMHADHVTGLPGILMLSSQVDRDEPLYIIGPPRLRSYIESNRRILDMHINYKIVVIEISEPGVVYRGSGYCVKAFPLRHTRLCYGYSFEEKARSGVFYPEKAEEMNVPKGPLWSKLQNGNSVELPDGRIIAPDQIMGPVRRGRKFCFITDTVYVPRVEEHVKYADLLICDGMFERDLMSTAKEKKHLTAYEAALIAANGFVQRLGLIHYSPRYTEWELQKLLTEAREVYRDAFLTTELQQIELPYQDG